MVVSEQQTDGNLTLQASARRLGIARHTLRRWAIYEHKIPFYRLGRRLLFAPADLDAFLARHRVGAHDEASNGAAPAKAGGVGVAPGTLGPDRGPHPPGGKRGAR